MRSVGGRAGTLRLGGSAILLVCAVLSAALLAGCGTSRSDYIASANSSCKGDQHGLDNKHKPKTTQDGIDYALNYFTDLDKAVSQIREMREPSKQSADLHRLWLDPARQSLKHFFHHDLPRIRRASNDGDAAVVHRELQKLHHVAGQGVDEAYLRRIGLTACADTLFSAS